MAMMVMAVSHIMTRITIMGRRSVTTSVPTIGAREAATSPRVGVGVELAAAATSEVEATRNGKGTNMTASQKASLTSKNTATTVVAGVAAAGISERKGSGPRPRPVAAVATSGAVPAAEAVSTISRVCAVAAEAGRDALIIVAGRRQPLILSRRHAVASAAPIPVAREGAESTISASSRKHTSTTE